MKDLVSMTVVLLILIVLLILMSGIFKGYRIELKRAKWKAYPRIKPKNGIYNKEGENLQRFIVSRLDGSVIIDTYNFEKKAFETYDDVDAWREIPLSYKNTLKIIKGILGKIREKKRK